MDPVNYIFEISHPITSKKLYSVKVTHYNNSTSLGLTSAIFADGNSIFDPGAYTLEFTYAHDNILPTLTAFEVLSSTALTNPPADLQIRLKTSDKLLFDFQADIVDGYSPNYQYLVTNSIGASDLFYSIAVISITNQRLFSIDMLPTWPTSVPGWTGSGSGPSTISRSGILGTVAIYPTLSEGPTTKSCKAETYYINRLLKMGYTMNQIVPSSLYTSYTSVYMTFPSYELRQLFMDGNLVLNGCRSEKGRIY
jgi:hypothetical protein